MENSVSKALDQIKSEYPELIIDDISVFQKREKIGHGASSEVFLVENIKTKKKFALKHVFEAQDESIIQFAREVKTMASLHHPFLLNIYGFFPKPPFSIVMEYVSGGSLYKNLNSPSESKKIGGTKRTKIAMGIADAMDNLHKNNFIHRDLKSLNILLDENFSPRVCDFGVSRILETSRSNLTKEIGTCRWMAPEIFENKDYDQKIDIYSFGLVLYELVTNTIPWIGKENPQIMYHVLEGIRPPLPEDTPQELANLIEICWDQYPEKRPSFSYIYSQFAEHKVAFAGTNPKKIDKLNNYLKKYKEINSSVQKLKYVIPKHDNPNEITNSMTSKDIFIHPSIHVRSQEQFDLSIGGVKHSKLRFSQTSIKQNQDYYQFPSSPANIRFSDDNSQELYVKSKDHNQIIHKRVKSQHNEKFHKPNLYSNDSLDNQRNNNSSPEKIDINAILNSKNPQFKSELLRASKEIQNSQMKDFFSAISFYFSSKTNKNDMILILKCILPILKS